MKLNYVMFMLCLISSGIITTIPPIDYKVELNTDEDEPYVPVYVNCRIIFELAYSEWIYMLSREKQAADKFYLETLNPLNIGRSEDAMDQYQKELEELLRYRGSLLKKLMSTIRSVADWYNANEIILFYNHHYMWVHPDHDITQEVINELNDYSDYISQLITIHEGNDGTSYK